MALGNPFSLKDWIRDKIKRLVKAQFVHEGLDVVFIPHAEQLGRAGEVTLGFFEGADGVIDDKELAIRASGKRPMRHRLRSIVTPQTLQHGGPCVFLQIGHGGANPLGSIGRSAATPLTATAALGLRLVAFIKRKSRGVG